MKLKPGTPEHDLLMERFRYRLAALEDEDTLWCGLVQLLEDLRDQGALSVAQPNVAADARAYNSGRLAQVIDLQGVVEELRVQGRKELDGDREMRPN